MTTISNGTDTLAPTQIDGYTATRRSLNTVHETLSGRIVTTTGPMLPRRGTLRMVFAIEADAWRMLTIHRDAAVLTLADSTMPRLNMLYVIDSDAELTIELDDETRNVWTLEVPFAEVLP